MQTNASIRNAYWNTVGWRIDFLRRPTPFSWQERLSYALPGGVRSVDELFMRRLARDEAGERFDVGGMRLYFKEDESRPASGEALNGAMTILKEVFVHGCGFFCDEVKLKRGDTVLDLGGNIGTSAFQFARLIGPEGRVISFEPVFHRVIARNIDANGATNIEVVPAAVGREDGTTEFVVPELGINSRMAASGLAGDRRIEVPVRSLDSFVAERGLDRVDFIKLDIEGAEELAIRGAGELIERFRPVWSIASYHTDYEGDRQHPKLMRLLRDLGYTVREIGQRHIFAWPERKAG